MYGNDNRQYQQLIVDETNAINQLNYKPNHIRDQIDQLMNQPDQSKQIRWINQNKQTNK